MPYQLETEIHDAKGALLARPHVGERNALVGDYCLRYRMHDLCEDSRHLHGLPGASVPYRVVFTVRLVEISEEYDADGPWENRTVVRELSCDRWVR